MAKRPKMEWHLDEELDFEGRHVRWTKRGQGPPMVLVRAVRRPPWVDNQDEARGKRAARVLPLCLLGGVLISAYGRPQVHGTPWSSFNLRHLVALFQSTYTVYTFDLLGYGESSKAPGDVSLKVQNKVLARLFEVWGVRKPVVVGHDFGGATALRGLLLNKLEYSHLVLIDPVAVSPWGSPFFNHVRQHEQAFAGVPAYIHEAIVRAYVETAAFKTLSTSTLDEILSAWRGAEGQAAFYRQIAQASSDYTQEVQPLYGSIDVPVLLIWGREDTWIPLERGRELQQLIGENARLAPVAGAGHLIIEEDPDAIAAEINAFVNDHTPARPRAATGCDSEAKPTPSD